MKTCDSATLHSRFWDKVRKTDGCWEWIGSKRDGGYGRAQLVSVQAETVEVAKFKGASVRKKWKAKVTDKAKLVAFIGANPQFLNLLEIDESALNKMAGAMEKNLESTLPGIEVYQESILGSRSA